MCRQAVSKKPPRGSKGEMQPPQKYGVELLQRSNKGRLLQIQQDAEWQSNSKRRLFHCGKMAGV
jgi:hypothetical protein